MNWFHLVLFVSFVHQIRSWCLDDGIKYTKEGTYIIASTSSWFSQFLSWTSYIYLDDSQNNDMIALLFTDIDQINCQTSSLDISDGNQNVVSFCNLPASDITDNSFAYLTKNAQRISIQKMGAFSVTLQIKYLSSIPETSDTEIKTTTLSPPTMTTKKTTSMPININNDSQRDCGKTAIEPFNAKIVGGIAAKPKSWPWQVLLSDFGTLCGGSLINNRWIITAAHCKFYVPTLFASLGEYDRTNLTDNIMRVKVDKMIPHPGFGNPLISFELDWDIALIKLKTPISFSDEVSPICLPNGKRSEVGQDGITTGWGVTKNDNTDASPILRQISTPVVQTKECFPDLQEEQLTDRQICAGSTDPLKSSCYGDSGGPYVIHDQSSSSYYLAGLVSGSYGDCDAVNFYTSIAAMEDWILDTMNNN